MRYVSHQSYSPHVLAHAVRLCAADPPLLPPSPLVTRWAVTRDCHAKAQLRATDIAGFGTPRVHARDSLIDGIDVEIKFIWKSRIPGSI